MRWRQIGLVVVALGAAACSRNVVVSDGPAGSSSRSRVVATSTPTVSTEGENRSTAATLGIPPGHLPPPGQCRVWMPGVPPGRQKHAPTGSCSEVDGHVPPGGWLVYRPSENKKEVKVWVYGQDRPGVVAIRWFDAISGALLREQTPGS